MPLQTATGATDEDEELLEDEIEDELELDTSELELELTTALDDELELDASELELELTTTALEDELLLDETAGAELALELEVISTLIQSVVSLGIGFQPALLL